MGIYRLNFIYQLGNDGWTETYYREHDSARLASELGGYDNLKHWIEFRPTGVKLVAIRAQEVTGLRRVYLRELGLSGLADAPDVVSTAAVLQLDFAGTAGRDLWLRGLADSQVKRRQGGLDNPQPALIAGLRGLSRTINELALLGRQIVNSHPWSYALSFGPDPDEPQVTRARVWSSFQAAPGDVVYFGHKAIGLQPERGYLVIDRDGDELILVNPWPTNTGVITPDKPIRVRKLEYVYPRLDGCKFKFFRKHTTGPAYRPVSWVADGIQRMPMHPCGRMVDRLRTCYQTAMRPFRHDIGVTVPVKWYFVPEGRPAVPFEHPFASRNWELDSEYPTLLGEIYERTHYAGRAPIDLNGVGLCGSREAWENGAGPAESIKPINPTTGQPCCCGPGVLNVSGGATAGPLPPATVVKGGAAAGGLTYPFEQFTEECSEWNPSPLEWRFVHSSPFSGCSLPFFGDLPAGGLVAHTFGCRWFLGTQVFTLFGTLNWFLAWNFPFFGSGWRLRLAAGAGGSPYLEYHNDGADWVNFGPNTMHLVQDFTGCTEVPTELTITAN